MEKWKSYLKADNTGWLLENDDPSARHLTLITIMDRKKKTPKQCARKKK